MPLPSFISTGVSDVSDGAQTRTFVPRGGLTQCGFDEELCRLLRGRLLLVHLLTLVLVLLLAAMIGLTPMAEQEGIIQPRGIFFWMRLAAQFAEAVLGAIALWRFSGMTLRSLRLWEAAFFLTNAAAAGLNRFEVVQDLAADAEGRLTRIGTVLGTPDYMSPGQAAGDSAVDARGDVYCLGAVAFFALTGRPPFQGKTLGQILAAHRLEPPPPLTDFRSDVPADLAAVVARCLAKDPADRFPSAAAFDRALAECRCAADWSAERAAEWWQAKTGEGRLSGASQEPVAEIRS